MKLIQSHMYYSPAFKASLSDDKETKSIIEQVSAYGNKQDRMRAYALEKLLNKLDTDDKYALVRDKYETIWLKIANSNATVPLTDRPESFDERLEAPRRAIKHFFDDMCIFFIEQTNISQFTELMWSIKSDFDKIDK